MSTKAPYLGMTEQPSSITLLFRDSENYRRLITIAKRSQKNLDEEYELIFGSSSVFLRRTSNPKEVTLYSHASWTNLLFGTMLLIDPKQVLLTGFQNPSIVDPFTHEFMRCIQACATSCTDCFIKNEDPESFHQFRLALRAYRSFLDIADNLGMKGVDVLRERAKILSKSSNPLRDSDVHMNLYAKFSEPIPLSVQEENAILREAALVELENAASLLWFESLRVATQIMPLDRFTKQLKKACVKESEKIEKIWKKLDLRNDIDLHALRIRMKKLSYALGVLKTSGKPVETWMKTVKAIQSRLGDIRDLRRFYILAGLDCETRFRAVQRLSSIEHEVKSLLIETEDTNIE